tara:strand:- start:1698 stop:2597 length:900 start_codon:yes stop_codon:yes gene_type:complete
MRFILTVLLILLTPPAVACEVDLIAHPDSNPKPIKWMKDALVKHRVCFTLMSMPTKSSGQNDRRHKRGHRDTIVIIPDGLESASSAEIIYWFHGLTGFSKKTFEKRLAPQYSWLVRKQSWPAILVVAEMPWSNFTSTQWKRQGRVFRKKNEFLSYTSEVEEKVVQILRKNKNFVFKRIIVGHSAGGSAIASAAKYGGLCETKPVAVVFSDSTYGRWFDRSWSGCLGKSIRDRKFRILVLGQSFGKPWKNYIRWKKRHKQGSRFVEAYRLPFPWTHGRIGNNAIPFFYGRFSSGKYENIY